MTQRLGIALALCLILQSISAVLLQDPSEFGGGGNDAFSDEYITQVPTVDENDVVEEAVDDHPSDGSLADGSMTLSGLEDSQTTISILNLGENEEEEPVDSSDTISTVTLSPDDSLDSKVQEDASENSPTASPSHTFDLSWLRKDESLSMSNDSSDTSAVPESISRDTDSTEIASAEANSTDVITSTETNSTDIFNTDTNSTEVTSTEANSTETITPSSESNSSDVTNPLTPEPTNPPGVNDTTGGLNPVTENPTENETAENIPGPTAENIPNTTEENIPEPTAENTPEPTAENIPVPTTENLPDPTTENIPEPTAEENPNDTIPPNADATALAKAAAAGNADQGSDSGTQNTANGRAWGVILGIAVTVGVVGLIIYIIQKRKQHPNFSHSKLVEDGQPDPVLRLDNSEPLDLKYDGFGYYNPELQGDNIQMSNFPSGHPR